MRLIDADETITQIKADCKNLDVPKEWNKGINFAIGRILRQPTADVRENEYGEWIKMDKRGNNVRCSKCGNTLDLRGVNVGRGDANYCPNCGSYNKG